MNQTDNLIAATDPKGPVQALVKCEYFETKDEEFTAFIEKMPETHWARYDLSAVRLGWEAHKLLST